MTSKFGGVPIEKKSIITGSKFGGVPIEESGQVFTQPQQNKPVQAVTQPKRPSYAKYAIEKPPEPQRRSLIKDIGGLGELALATGTGIVAEPVSGIAGLAKTITSGPGAGAETTRQIQEAMTYQPRTKVGKELAGELGGYVEGISKLPGIKQTKEKYEELTERQAKFAGPVAATAMKMLPSTLMMWTGLKGSKGLKTAKMKSGLKKLDKTEFYDSSGFLNPDIKKQIMESGLSMEDVKEFLPENITSMKLAGPMVDKIRKKKAAALAEQVKPDIEAIKAFKELDVDFLPSHVSQNPTYVAIEQNLLGVPGSLLNPKLKAIISDLGKKADELIIRGGGEIDKGIVSERFRTDSHQIVSKLGDKASELYDKVNTTMPNNTIVKTDSIIGELKSIADDLGGRKYLNPKEKILYSTLSKETKPTYARLDKFRKQIGEALRKQEGPFKDSDRASLARMYKALGDDQEKALLNFGDKELLDTYLAGKKLTMQRKGIEDQLRTVIGKDLTGEITQKARPAILDLQKGSSQRFDKLVGNIPDELGDTKKSVLATALNDAFVQGSRAERSLNIAGFDDWMKGVKRHKNVYSKLQKELGNNTVKRLETLHKVVGSIRLAQAEAVTTGRSLLTPGIFDESKGVAARLYGKAEKLGEKLPFVRGWFTDVLKQPKNARSIAADKLLSNSQFQDLIRKKAIGKLDTAAKIKSADKWIRKMKQYKQFKKHLKPNEIRAISSVGLINYFTGEGEINSSK